MGLCLPYLSICSPAANSKDFFVCNVIDDCHQWKRNLLPQLVPESICETILSIFISSIASDDKLVWGLIVDGRYSIKSGVSLLQGLVFDPHQSHLFGFGSWPFLQKLIFFIEGVS